MFNTNHLSPFVLVAAAVFLGASSHSYAGAAHRSVSESSGDANRCPGCSTTNFVATLSGGPIKTMSANKTETFYLQPDIEKTYTATKNTNSNATGELFLGMQTMIEDGFRGQIGFAYAIAGNSISGHIWEDALPIFDDFTYKYNVKNTRYAVKAKLLEDIPYHLIGYASASAGVAVNKASSFSIYPIIPEAVPAPSFSNNTEMSFTYSLGAGVEYPLSKNFQVGVGYEFANWGKNSLSRAPGQSLNNGLGVSHLYTNELLFSISFIA